jgi:hypothetical protein
MHTIPHLLVLLACQPFSCPSLLRQVMLVGWHPSQGLGGWQQLGGTSHAFSTRERFRKGGLHRPHHFCWCTMPGVKLLCG